MMLCPVGEQFRFLKTRFGLIFLYKTFTLKAPVGLWRYRSLSYAAQSAFHPIYLQLTRLTRRIADCRSL